MDRKIRRAIGGIGENAWTGIRYPQAIWDDDEQRWISDAEVAEVVYTAFASRRRRAVTARLVVRRVRRLAPDGQTELTAAWRYHAVFTDSPFRHPSGRVRPPRPRHYRTAQRRADRRTPGPPAVRIVRRQCRLVDLHRDRPQPATRRRHAGLALPRPRPHRHAAPPPDHRPGPDRAPWTRPDRAAPTPALALARPPRRAVRRDPPGTTGPRGLIGPGTGPAPPDDPRGPSSRSLRNRVGHTAEPSAADTARPHPTETIIIQGNDHPRFVGGSRLRGDGPFNTWAHHARNGRRLRSGGECSATRRDRSPLTRPRRPRRTPSTANRTT